MRPIELADCCDTDGKGKGAAPLWRGPFERRDATCQASIIIGFSSASAICLSSSAPSAPSITR